MCPSLKYSRGYSRARLKIWRTKFIFEPFWVLESKEIKQWIVEYQITVCRNITRATCLWYSLLYNCPPNSYSLLDNSPLELIYFFNKEYWPSGVAPTAACLASCSCCCRRFILCSECWICEEKKWLSEPRHEKTCLREFPTRSDSNRPAQPQKLAWGLKFWIQKLETLHYLGSEQQRHWSDCADAQADLRLCCSHMT